MSNYYPNMDSVVLFPTKLVLGSMLNDPLWLDRAECPYDTETKDELRTLFSQLRAPGKTVRAEVARSGDRMTDLSDDLDTLFNDLREFSGHITEGDTKEWMAYYRTATSLLDKITGLSERALNVKAVSDFQAKVIAVFDDILTPELRTLAMEKLGK